MTSTLTAPPAAPILNHRLRIHRLRRAMYEPEPGTGGDLPLPVQAPAGPAAPPTTAAERVEAQHEITRVLRLALEVLDGRRAPAHLAGHLTPPVLRYWRAATEQRRPRTTARFTRMRLCLPRSGAAEVAVTCDIDGRPRAVAARFDRTRSGWRCTALRLG